MTKWMISYVINSTIEASCHLDSVYYLHHLLKVRLDSRTIHYHDRWGSPPPFVCLIVHYKIVSGEFSSSVAFHASAHSGSIRNFRVSSAIGGAIEPF